MASSPPDLAAAPGGADAEAPPFLLEAAERLGARLCRDAVWADERCAWIAPVDRNDPDGAWRTVHEATGPDLYAGTAGIALFLAHLHALGGGRAFRTVGLGAARHALSRLQDVPEAQRLALHGGWTGIALAAWQVEAATGADGLAAPALDALEALPVGAAREEGDTLDVVGGAAGAVAPLLALARATGRTRLREQAHAAGERLLGAAERAGEAASWATITQPGEPHLCGAAHGASGIATALLELHADAPDAPDSDRLRTTARAAFAFEAGHFDPAAGGWPDLRAWVAAANPGAPPPVGATWCHGAAGGALVRLRALQLDPAAPGLREHATRALHAAAAAAQARDGHDDCSLCHGAAGLGEALLDGAATLGDPALRDAALALAHRHAAARRAGTPSRSGLISGLQTPALMLGDAGLGHHLLRLAAPERVPSILQVRTT